MRINVEIDTSRPRKDGTCALRLTFYQGTLARYPLDRTVDPKHWDEKRRLVRFGAVPNWHEINGAIQAALAKAERIAHQRPGIGPKELAAAMLTDRSGALLVDAIREDLKEHEHRLTYGTRKVRWTIIHDLKEALPYTTLERLSSSEIVTLDRWYTLAGLSVNTRRSRLRRLRTMYRSACRGAGIPHQDVFRGLIPAEVDTGAKFLTAAQIERLEQEPMPTPRMDLARDAWLLAFYLGGLRFGDVCRLDPSMYSDGAFTWVSGKVPRPRWAKVSAKAKRIVEKYEGGSRTLPLVALPHGFTRDQEARAIETANASVNRSLKEVARLCGLPPMTTHMARHSWAQAAKSATGDIHAVSKILGHTRTATTERYLSRFDREAVADIFSKMESE